MGGGTYYLGIDGGGTGCRARLVDVAGAVVGRGEAGPATLRLGAEAVWTQLMSAASAALGEAGFDDGDIQVHVAAGVAGTSRSVAFEALKSRPHVFASLTVIGDAHAACLGAHGGAEGGVVIAGTGAIGYGVTGGHHVQVGGYGFPISDLGSGADLGLDVLRLSIRAHDGAAAATVLTDAVLARFAGEPRRMTAWMDRATATDYATFAEVAVTYANAGDAAAQALVRAAAAHIGELVGVLRARGVTRVALLGGLAAAYGPLLRADLQAGLASPQGDAIDGALLIARRVAGG
jgi:glucosamine kinase